MVLAVVVTLGVAVPAAARPESTPPSTRFEVLAPNPHVPVGLGQGPERCVDVLLVGFRGSGAHPRGRTAQGEVSNRLPIPWRAADFTTPRPAFQQRRYGVTAAQDRLGTTLAALYEALSDQVTAQGRSIGFWSVGVDDEAGFGYGRLYKAPPVDVANLGAYLSSIRLDALMTTLGPVLESLVQGRNGRAPQCPDTELVLAGFSQGAVIARAAALDLLQQAEASGRPDSGVSDVVLIGDPLFERDDYDRFGAAFDDDHHTDGLLRLDLVAWCDRNRLTRTACTRYAGGDSRSRTWFRSVWNELRVFADQHPDLVASSAEDLAQRGTDVHLVCDSGDMVCSPIRWTSPFTWDSDIPEVLGGHPERTIHGTYAAEVDWGSVADQILTARRRI